MSSVFVKALRLNGLDIFQQLKLEEALLRTTTCNWFIYNEGIKNPAIVMGLSGKADKLLHVDQARQRGLPVIRRFTGGGTVVVDKDVIFSSFIVNAPDLPSVPCFPCNIMKWTGQVYKRVFVNITDFNLRQNDYVIGSRKIGGNAQSITKARWLHHTSFLWDYDISNINLLQLPSRQPKYREDRDHQSFLTSLGAQPNIMPRDDVYYHIVESLEKEGMRVQEVTLDEAVPQLVVPHLSNTSLVDITDVNSHLVMDSMPHTVHQQVTVNDYN